MRSENSVVTALAELGRMEQERVEGERRRVAEERVRRLEHALAENANARVEREVAAATARLRTDADAREQELCARVRSLESELVAARASSAALLEALAAHATEPASPARQSIPAVLVVLGVLACGLAGWTALLNARMAQVRAAAAQTLTPSSAAAPRSPRTELARPVVAAAPEPDLGAPPRPVSKEQRGMAQRPKHGERTKPDEEPDPLGRIDDCKDDPTCGLF